jgi:hypothetical protein
MRRITTSSSQASLLFVVLFSACGGQVDNDERHRAVAQSGSTASLYILDQSGCTNPWVLNDLFNGCMLDGAWNHLANTYPSGASLRFGGIMKPGLEICPVSWTQWQCAEDIGKWPLQDGDILMISHPKNEKRSYNGRESVFRPDGTFVMINFAEILTNECWWSLPILAVHEVFEASSDLSSCDCCNGQGSGACATNHVDHRLCNGKYYPVQQCSPAYHEWDGTCITP